MAFTPIKCWIFGSKLSKINIVSVPCEAFKLLRSFADYALVGKQLRSLMWKFSDNHGRVNTESGKPLIYVVDFSVLSEISEGNWDRETLVALYGKANRGKTRTV
jgi:hypothetical protein